MEVREGRVDISWSLVVGASLHWSSMLYLSLGPSQAIATGASDMLLWLHTPLVALLALVATLVPRLLEREVTRGAAEVISMASGVIALLILIGRAWSAVPENPSVAIAFELAVGINIGVMVLLWGFAFASLDKRSAGKNAALTALLSIMLALLIRPFAQVFEVGLAFSGIICRLASASVLLTRTVRFACVRRSPNAKARPALVRFYASRALLGAAIGVLYGAGTTDARLTFSSLTLVVIGFVIAAILMRTFLRVKDSLYGFLPVTPLIFVGLIFIPFAAGGSTALGVMAPTILWLCWIFTSSFQLSGLKETFGMSEARLSFSEKAVLMAGWTLGMLMSNSVISLTGLDPLALMASYGALVWATYTSFRTVYNRREDAFISQLESQRTKRDARVFDELTSRYGLTKREREVMEMLASGYTRPYICKTLSISDGTARAHAFHVYQKLGVHKKDDLLKLVRDTETATDAD